MASNNQFAIAVHILAVLGFHSSEEVCSGGIAISVNANPSFVRRILAKLSKANLVLTTPGKGGHCTLARPAKEISLLDIYRAVEAPPAFSLHQYPVQKDCAVSCGIKPFMEKVLTKSQKSLESSLKEVTLAETVRSLK